MGAWLSVTGARNIIYHEIFQFLGSIEVEIHEDSDGYVTILGHRPTSSEFQKSPKCGNFSDRSSPKVKKEEGQHR